MNQSYCDLGDQENVTQQRYLKHPHVMDSKRGLLISERLTLLAAKGWGNSAGGAHLKGGCS